jgi:hypothetical protein
MAGVSNMKPYRCETFIACEKVLIDAICQRVAEIGVRAANAILRESMRSMAGAALYRIVHDRSAGIIGIKRLFGVCEALNIDVAVRTEARPLSLPLSKADQRELQRQMRNPMFVAAVKRLIDDGVSGEIKGEPA